jgi:hypothetical protein
MLIERAKDRFHADFLLVMLDADITYIFQWTYLPLGVPLLQFIEPIVGRAWSGEVGKLKRTSGVPSEVSDINCMSSAQRDTCSCLLLSDTPAGGSW